MNKWFNDLKSEAFVEVDNMAKLKKVFIAPKRLKKLNYHLDMYGDVEIASIESDL